MLAEWLTHLTTPCPEPYRELGYLRELIAIKYRHQRCKTAWAPHLANCKALISEEVHKAFINKSAVVLGSGLLLDIPIDKLANHFETVYLVDICHLRETRNQAKAYPNIQFIEADISGVITSLMDWERGSKLTTPLSHLDILADADYVVSANLLTQLPLIPLEFLEKHNPDLSDDERHSFARNIIRHHLQMLSALSCPVTIITETLRVMADRHSNIQEVDPLYGQSSPQARQEWDWHLAPRPELGRNTDLRLRVAGITDLKE